MTRDRTPWLDRLLHLHDTPRRTAAAFALGVFFSFTPFIGLQILVSFGIAFLLGLNRLAVFVGLNANLPWLIVPWYAGTTIAAAHAMGIAVPADVGDQVSVLFSLRHLHARLLVARRRHRPAFHRAADRRPDGRCRRDRRGGVLRRPPRVGAAGEGSGVLRFYGSMVPARGFEP